MMRGRNKIKRRSSFGLDATPVSKPKPKPKKISPDRPLSKDLAKTLDALNAAHRPEDVPQNHHFLTAFVDIPGDNTQRRSHWATLAVWFGQVLADFQMSSNLQDHPGVIASPHVRIISFVSRVGDDVNKYGRLKKVIDTLQVPKYTATRKNKNGGYLSLIEDDKSLKIGTTIQAEERYAKAQDRKVMIWLWSGEENVEPNGQ